MAVKKTAKASETVTGSEKFDFQQISEFSPIATVIYDANFAIKFCNSAFGKLLGVKPEELEGQCLSDALSLADGDGAVEAFNAGDESLEVEFQKPDGTPFWGQVSTWKANNAKAKKATRLIAQIINIDDRKKDHSDLAYRESIWRNAIAASQLGVWDYNDLTKGRFYSDYWKHIRGIPLDEEARGDIKSWEARIHPDDLEGVRDHVRRQNSGEMKMFSFEYRERKRDGQWVWILSRGRAVKWAEDGTPIRMTGTDSDITARKNEEAKRAEHAAEIHLNHVEELKAVHHETKAAHRVANAKILQDSLTKLTNRCAFSEKIKKKIKAHQKGKPAFSLMIINLDKFRNINNKHGHLAGDLVLCEMAKRLKIAVTPQDVVARLGGDEFGIVLKGNKNQDAEHRAKTIATKIFDGFEEPIALGDHDIQIKASIGISLFPEHGKTAEDLLRAADIAMRDVKEGDDGNSWQIFSPDLDIEMASNDCLVALTREAVNNEEIHPFFLPIIDLKTENVVGFKVLPRWNHPDRGVITATNFLPIIEQEGMRKQFYASMLRQTCEASQFWPEDINLGLKVSAKGIVDPDVLADVIKQLAEFNITPNRMQIEVTEASIDAGGEAAKKLIGLFQNAGVRVVLDEFGTGKAGLNYLREYKFDGVRIDRSFIGSMGRSEASEKIVRSLISLANELGIYTIAEGIEDVDTHMYMQHTGATYGQGYFYAKPVSYEEATAMVQAPDSLLNATG